MATLILVPTALEAQELFGEAPAIGQSLALSDRLQLGLCGFGLAAAGVLSTGLLRDLRPERVLLCGIAGSHDLNRLPILSVAEGNRVRSYGLGSGSGSKHLSAGELGFPEVPGLTEVLPLAPQATALPQAGIVSVAAASADAAEAQILRQHHPDFLIEDMESWSVALACAVEKIPLQVLRAVANEAGDREKQNWRIGGALAALRQHLTELLSLTPDSKRG